MSVLHQAALGLYLTLSETQMVVGIQLCEPGSVCALGIAQAASAGGNVTCKLTNHIHIIIF